MTKQRKRTRLLSRDELRVVKRKEGLYEVVGEGITLEQKVTGRAHDVNGEWAAVKAGVTILKATGLSALIDLLVDGPETTDDPAEQPQGQPTAEEDKDYLDGV